MLMTHGDSADVFYLIDHDGNRRVPRKVQARDGRFGYVVHPAGLGNDPRAANYTEDEQVLVQQVVLHGKGVRCCAEGGPQEGQVNTLGLGGRVIRGYWLHPSKLGWVAGATRRPENDGARV